MLVRLVTVAAGLLVVIALSAGQAVEPKELSASHGAYSVHLFTSTQALAKTEEWWGVSENNGGTLRVVSRITIKHGKRLILVPVSAFSGLSLPYELSVLPIKRGCKVKLLGSDASGAYTCVIVVRSDEVIERTVRSGEFPELDYERTIYRTPRPGEID